MVRCCAFIFCILLFVATKLRADVSTNLSHPRLYFSKQELTKLQQKRNHGLHAKIYKNLIASAEWCLTKAPRQKWIAPVSPDPIYENLYDRFYGIMGDLAITEHLAFAYALSGKPKYGDATHDWVLASCRVWQHEAEGTPDSGKGYAVSRLLKGIAVGYDLAYDRFNGAERKDIRDTLVRIGNLYFQQYFQTPSISGPGFHTHHAVVEWSSFGVLALALLGETPEAQGWLDATTRKFEDHLLPTGLAPDGAQVEGGSFWASTMQYRLFFMDPLRRVTGRDLFKKFEQQMNADLALASIAAKNEPGYHQSYANIVQQPYYAQLDYYAPVLLFLAREYHHPIFQYLALWDSSLGHIQKTRAITPHGEQLSFELGGYAYIWCDPSMPARAEEEKLSFQFPSTDEAYLRTSWKPGDMLVGVWKGQMIIHAGGRPVLIETTIQDPPTDLSVQSMEDSGDFAIIHCGTNENRRVTIELNRKQRILTIRRKAGGDWQWWCQGKPILHGDELRWDGKTSLHLLQGKLVEFDPVDYAPPFATGFNKLKLLDPAPMQFPKIKIAPTASDEIVLEIKLKK